MGYQQWKVFIDFKIKWICRRDYLLEEQWNFEERKFYRIRIYIWNCIIVGKMTW